MMVFILPYASREIICRADNRRTGAHTRTRDKSTNERETKKKQKRMDEWRRETEVCE